MDEERVTYACPYCEKEGTVTREIFPDAAALRAHIDSAHMPKPAWGREIYPPPKDVGFVEVDDLKCVGCGLCAEACAMQHTGVMNKDYARIYVRKVLLPIPKAVAVTCCQCEAGERPCQEACPQKPPAIHFDENTLHMVIDKERCTGCLSCQTACGSEAIRFNEDAGETPFVCDLCDTQNTGQRNPQCAQICPTSALTFHNRMERQRAIRDTFRKSSEEKANLIARRLYPLTRESVAFPPWSAGQPKEGAK